MHASTFVVAFANVNVGGPVVLQPGDLVGSGLSANSSPPALGQPVLANKNGIAVFMDATMAASAWPQLEPVLQAYANETGAELSLLAVPRLQSRHLRPAIKNNRTIIVMLSDALWSNATASSMRDGSTRAAQFGTTMLPVMTSRLSDKKRTQLRESLAQSDHQLWLDLTDQDPGQALVPAPIADPDRDHAWQAKRVVVTLRDIARLQAIAVAEVATKQTSDDRETSQSVAGPPGPCWASTLPGSRPGGAPPPRR